MEDCTYAAEHNLILELCRFMQPDKGKIAEYLQQSLHWPYILGQLLFHRVGGAAYYTLDACNLLGKIHRECRNTLKTVYDSNVVKSASMKEALEEVGSLLQNVSFPYALLKGSYLVWLYPVGLRTSNDVDILINQGDITAIEEKLKQAGFVQGNVRSGTFVPASRKEIIASRMNRGETVPFIKQAGLPQMDFLEMDINFSLDFAAKQKNDAVSMLLRHAQPLIPTREAFLYTLEPVDFLIHLCCHLFKEATVYAWVAMERDLSLYKFMDLYMLIHKWTDASWYSALEASIRAYGLERECYYALRGTKELFGIENVFLDRLLLSICPSNISYLQSVMQPDTGKTYCYKESFVDWVFMSKKKEKLYETADETP